MGENRMIAMGENRHQTGIVFNAWLTRIIKVVSKFDKVCLAWRDIKYTLLIHLSRHRFNLMSVGIVHLYGNLLRISPCLNWLKLCDPNVLPPFLQFLFLLMQKSAVRSNPVLYSSVIQKPAPVFTNCVSKTTNGKPMIPNLAGSSFHLLWLNSLSLLVLCHPQGD